MCISLKLILVPRYLPMENGAQENMPANESDTNSPDKGPNAGRIRCFAEKILNGVKGSRSNLSESLQKMMHIFVVGAATVLALVMNIGLLIGSEFIALLYSPMLLLLHTCLNVGAIVKRIGHCAWEELTNPVLHKDQSIWATAMRVSGRKKD